MIDNDVAELVSIRRDIHAHPETAFQEHRTADLIAKTLTTWGVQVERGLGKTGIVGIVKGGASRRTIGLRADMDALPMTERNSFAHASVHTGRMHACGHDGHTATLLAAAKHLATHRNFDGTVYLIFQPAEEGGRGGAREMIRDGLFERFPMDAIFGVHNWPGLPVGQFAIKTGAVFASGNKFKITIRGKGSHAAMPDDGIDPIPIACQIVQAFQTIVTRNKRPKEAAVFSVTMIHAGEAVNVVPELCEIQGTVRTFTPRVTDLIEKRMKSIADATCAAFDASCDFDFDRYYPPTINHAAETNFARSVLRSMVGEENVREFEPTMSSEDFSFYLLEKPGCYLVIGNGESRALHNPGYDFNDELIPIGGSMWVQLVEAWFSR